MAENADLSQYGLSENNISPSQSIDKDNVDLTNYGLEEQKENKSPNFPIVGQFPDPSNPEVLKKILTPPTEEDIRKASLQALPLVAPELKVLPYIGNVLSKIPFGKILGRIGYGAVLSTAPAALEGSDNLREQLTRNTLLNAALETGTWPLRVLGKTAEAINPIKYTQNKLITIKNEASAAKALEKETYGPVFKKYANSIVANNPIKYLSNAGIDKNKLYPEAKKYYEEFIRKPNFQNLHNLQSQIGRDIGLVRKAKNKPLTTQRFTQYRNSIKNLAENHLKDDINMLNQYKLGSQIRRDVVEPFGSTPNLRKISKGTKKDVTPEQLKSSIKSGREKIIGEDRFGNAITAIPKGHALENHLKDLDKAISRGNALKAIVPGIAGATLGEIIHPGLGGILGGAGGLMGAHALASKLGGPSVTGLIQEPWVQNILNELEPAYYGAGRGLISSDSENK